MFFTFDCHENQHKLHVGCEAPHAYFIPFANERAAGGRRAASPYFTSLCGDWDFRFYKTLSELEDFRLPEFDRAAMDKMPVPRSWQTVLNKGYDTPNYTNVNYPFTFDPPHVPDNNPCGLYLRDFYMDAKTLAAKRIYLNFEGVDSCFYLFVNNKFAAYSQVSHMTSEVDITDYLTEGKNTLAVVVLKWCDGSYLEDQDKFRFSGIPTFEPEHFMLVSPKDTMKRKQFVKGVEQIAQEGAIQIFKIPDSGFEDVVVGVVGTLQFDVFEYRMKNEYGVDLRMSGLSYEHLRLIRECPCDVKDLMLCSGSRVLEDFKGRKLIAFGGEWSVGFLTKHNEGLILDDWLSV